MDEEGKSQETASTPEKGGDRPAMPRFGHHTVSVRFVTDNVPGGAACLKASSSPTRLLLSLEVPPRRNAQVCLFPFSSS